MDRPGRTRKPVNYSQFDNDDEDFTFSTAPPSKKPRVKDVLLKKEKKEKSSKMLQKAVTERTPLDEKLYQRDLEVALALSVQDAPIEVHASPSNETCANAETNEVSRVPLISNCSVDSGVLELDKITDVKDHEVDIRRRRVAASKAITDQRKMVIDDSEGEDKCEEYKPDLASDAESESDSNFSEEDEGFESALKKCKKSKNIKKKETKLKVSSEKVSKSPKSRLPSTVNTTSSASTSKMKSLPISDNSVSPKSVGSPIQRNSPPVIQRKPSWTPPSASGSSNNALSGISVKSPNQSLRLGLSRFARVKPLHPSVASS